MVHHVKLPDLRSLRIGAPLGLLPMLSVTLVCAPYSLCLSDGVSFVNRQQSAKEGRWENVVTYNSKILSACRAFCRFHLTVSILESVQFPFDTSRRF